MKFRGEGSVAAVLERKIGAIVIADGVESERALASAALRRAGYDTIDVSTGLEVLDAVRENGVALIVLEVGLPDMTGYEVCREIRSQRGDELPIFFLSGLRTEPLDRVAGLLLGADDFIVKPFDRAELVARVRRFITRRDSANSAAGGKRTANVPYLTEREREILARLAHGAQQTKIAEQL